MPTIQAFDYPVVSVDERMVKRSPRASCNWRVGGITSLYFFLQPDGSFQLHDENTTVDLTNRRDENSESRLIARRFFFY